MRFKLILQTANPVTRIPVNYQYPLSAAIYKILDRADGEYAAFLHQSGYGKGFKLFTFSQIQCAFKVERDRFIILGHELTFEIAFHLPDAIENFIKGLFQTEKIEIADKVSKAAFTVASVETLPNPLGNGLPNEITQAVVRPSAPLVAGLHNEKGNYTFLSPTDAEFTQAIIYNWREKIKTCFTDEICSSALLLAEMVLYNNAPKSRLITIKAGTPQETRVRGWMNFGLQLTAERRCIEVLMNCGAGVYNAMGCGMVDVV